MNHSKAIKQLKTILNEVALFTSDKEAIKYAIKVLENESIKKYKQSDIGARIDGYQHHDYRE